MKYSIILAAILTLGCTDTKRASIAAYGSSAEVTCYSGGQVVYKGHSSGRVESTQNSDGWEFKDDSTGKFMRVSGDCIVSN
jgi:hypothetical protein